MLVRRERIVAICILLGHQAGAQAHQGLSIEMRGGGLLLSSSIPSTSASIRPQPAVVLGAAVAWYPTVDHPWGVRLVTDVAPDLTARVHTATSVYYTTTAFLGYVALDGVRHVASGGPVIIDAFAGAAIRPKIETEDSKVTVAFAGSSAGAGGSFPHLPTAGGTHAGVLLSGASTFALEGGVYVVRDNGRTRTDGLLLLIIGSRGAP